MTKKLNENQANDLLLINKNLNFISSIVAGAHHEMNNVFSLINGMFELIILQGSEYPNLNESDISLLKELHEKCDDSDKGVSVKVILEKFISYYEEYEESGSDKDLRLDCARKDFQDNLKKIESMLKELRNVIKDGFQDPVTWIDVEDVVNRVEKLTRTRFRNHRIFLSKEIESDLKIETQEVVVIQSLLELFTHSHGSVMEEADKWITIKAYKKDKKVNIEIVDSGEFLEESTDEIISSNYNKNGRDGFMLYSAKMSLNKLGGNLEIVKLEDTKELKFIVTLPQEYPIGAGNIVSGEVRASSLEDALAEEIYDEDGIKKVA